jgi:UDP-glucuronate decarboxylase
MAEYAPEEVVATLIREELDEDLKEDYSEERLSTTSLSSSRLVFNEGTIRRRRNRVLVTGGCGFIGSHLVDRLMSDGDNDVIVVDNCFSGDKANIEQWIGHPRFEFIRHDVTDPIQLEVDQIYHLACPASPVFYQDNPIKTIKTSVLGTMNMLGLAKRTGATILLSSTSEVYGDPLEHPQTEEYWGNVNPIGIRSCYDEGKRIAETLMFEYYRKHEVKIRIARIFNTYGPRMLENDGRVVSNFIVQCLKGDNLTVYGDGSQTRSFCYVDDMVNGLMGLMNSEAIGPVNIGNPGEYTILQLAEAIQSIVDPSAEVAFKPLPSDDPKKRKPNITKARELLGWEPTVSLMEGLYPTIVDFHDRLLAQGVPVVEIPDLETLRESGLFEKDDDAIESSAFASAIDEEEMNIFVEDTIESALSR